MKTNQLMKRKMGDFSVTQRTKDGFFNATYLLKQWNQKHTSERKMDNYFNSEKSKEFIFTIMERENLHTPKLVYVKSKASRGENAGTWINDGFIRTYEQIITYLKNVYRHKYLPAVFA